MIKKVQISGMRLKDKIHEYLIVSDQNSIDEEYFNLAWKCALKQFPMDADRKSHHRFTVSDYLA